MQGVHFNLQSTSTVLHLHHFDGLGFVILMLLADLHLRVYRLSSCHSFFFGSYHYSGILEN